MLLGISRCSLYVFVFCLMLYLLYPLVLYPQCSVSTKDSEAFCTPLGTRPGRIWTSDVISSTRSTKWSAATASTTSSAKTLSILQCFWQCQHVLRSINRAVGFLVGFRLSVLCDVSCFLVLFLISWTCVVVAMLPCFVAASKRAWGSGSGDGSIPEGHNHWAPMLAFPGVCLTFLVGNNVFQFWVMWRRVLSRDLSPRQWSADTAFTTASTRSRAVCDRMAARSHSVWITTTFVGWFLSHA